MVYKSRLIFVVLALLEGVLALRCHTLEKGVGTRSGGLECSAMAVGKGFFDQYSVFCVFGSVVGCVVVPLITQSVECVIFSAIVISLTAATHLNKKTNTTENSCKASPFKENDRKKHKDGHAQLTKKRSKERQSSVQQRQSSIIQRKYEQSPEDTEEQRQLEMERRLEEKKLKKAKKKEERLKRKVEESKIKQELEERQKLVYNRRLKQHKEEVKLNSKGLGSGSIASLDRFGHEEPECMQIRRKLVVDENNKPSNGIRIPRFERPRLLTHPCSSKLPRTVNRSPASCMGLSVTIPSLSASNSSLSSSGSSQEQERLTPPPSVWKLPPQNVEPKWNPGQTQSKTMKTKRCSSTDKWLSKDPKGSSLHGLTFTGNNIINMSSPHSSTVMTVETTPKKVESSRKPGKNESLFASQPDDKIRGDGQLQYSEYSLFGPNQLDKVLFKHPVL